MLMDLSKISENVNEIARQAGFFILSEKDKLSSSDIKSKGKNDFVSYVDKASEKMIAEALFKLLPDAGFIAEEGTASGRKGEYNWIIDPLDGTTNFIHGFEPFAVSIALAQAEKLLLGTVYEIGKNECFSAIKGGGAFLNGESIQVSDIDRLADSLIVTGFPYQDFGRMDDFIRSFVYLMQNTHGLRRPGSAATDLAYLAAGRSEAFYEYGLHAWDVAARTLLVEEAGGIVTDFSGKKDKRLFGSEIIASNSKLFKDFQKIVCSYMCKK